METKICIKCGKEKKVSLFTILKRSKDGYNNTCKECLYGHKPIKRFTRNSELLTEKECLTCKQLLPINNFDTLTKAGKKYYMASCKKCRNNVNSVNRKQSKHYRKRDLIRDYGLTLPEYNDMIEIQESKCLICGTHLKDLLRGLCVDHCHTTGKVRGLLCHNCNSGLGLFKDNIEFLKSAILYLQEVK